MYDVSDPASPVHVATYPTPRDAQRVDLKGALAYVADGPAGLTVVDLSTPARPQVVGTFKTRNPTRGVAVADTAVLVARRHAAAGLALPGRRRRHHPAADTVMQPL